MVDVKIVGAGSIGNHLAHGCRQRGWAVTLCDLDPAALERTREQIYPERYGAWDDGIALSTPECVANHSFDVIIVGTPPDTHLAAALQQLSGRPPRLLLIEKPLGTPDLAGCDALVEAAQRTGTRVLVGYNHRLTRHTLLARDWLDALDLGAPLTLSAQFREHWGGIFAAHPWLDGPADSYLGHTRRGGGALGEHSHALNIWQYFAMLCGQGRVVKVSAALDEVVADGLRYDRIAQLSLWCEGGLLGDVVQDVVTRPPRKWLRLQCERGHVEWQVNARPGFDLVRACPEDDAVREELVAKTRPDDFAGEIAHLGELLDTPTLSSPIDLKPGLDTLRVIAAALTSARNGCAVDVDYRARTPELQC
ncbi:MAG: Gfo/Idh/MocA family oxidoreductase [Pseudomonadales bacterium]|jgi:predicted dehydrogenase